MLSTLRYIVSIASKNNGYVYGGYVRDILVPQLHQRPVTTTDTDIHLHFYNIQNENGFIQSVKNEFKLTMRGVQHIHHDVTCVMTTYIVERNPQLKFVVNITVSPISHIDDFDVNTLAYQYVDPIEDKWVSVARAPFGSTAAVADATVLIERILQKKATALPTFFMNNKSTDKVEIESKFKLIKHMFHSKGWEAYYKEGCQSRVFTKTMTLDHFRTLFGPVGHSEPNEPTGATGTTGPTGAVKSQDKSDTGFWEAYYQNKYSIPDKLKLIDSDKKNFVETELAELALYCERLSFMSKAIIKRYKEMDALVAKNKESDVRIAELMTKFKEVESNAKETEMKAKEMEKKAIETMKKAQEIALAAKAVLEENVKSANEKLQGVLNGIAMKQKKTSGTVLTSDEKYGNEYILQLLQSIQYTHDK